MKLIYENRFNHIKNEMKNQNMQGLIVCDPYSILYLSGIWNDPFERMYALYIGAEEKPKLFVNRLFNIPENDFEEFWFTDTDNYVKILADNICKNGKIGIDKTWAARFLLPLMKYNPNAEYVLGSEIIDDIRGCKDEEEIRLMKEASRINDICIQRGLDYIKEGVTEIEVAKYIDSQFILEGASGPSFETMVGFGANAADPHHSPDNTVIKEGDCILIDMGCIKDGYCSDMTRTAFFKKADEEYTKIHDLVRSANEKAESIIKPGIPICSIDAAARDMISDAGYGKYFTHRLGHFCGQTVHEAGDVNGINQNLTKEGMIFSIEPGVYLSGKFGVRVEDLVLVTKDGCEILNHVDKNWKIIG